MLATLVCSLTAGLALGDNWRDHHANEQVGIQMEEGTWKGLARLGCLFWLLELEVTTQGSVKSTEFSFKGTMHSLELRPNGEVSLDGVPCGHFRRASERIIVDLELDRLPMIFNYGDRRFISFAFRKVR